MKVKIALAGGALALVPAAPAQAQLGLPLPDIGGIVTQIGDQVGGALPVGGGLVSGTTGTVGGIVTGVQQQVTGTLDQAVGDVLDGATGALPLPALDQLLQVVTVPGAAGAPGAKGTPGAPGAAAPTPVGASGPVVIDSHAPTVDVKVLSRLVQVGRTGSLRLQVRSDEAGVVVLGAMVRPGHAVKRKGRAVKGHSRKLIKFGPTTLAYRSAGTLNVTVKLGAQARRTLGRSKTARIGIATIAADLQRNQAPAYVKKGIKR